MSQVFSFLELQFDSFLRVFFSLLTLPMCSCKSTFSMIVLYILIICLFTKSCQIMWPHGLQHARLSCPSLSPGVCLNSCPLQRRQWQPTPALLPCKSPRRRSLVGCSPWGPEQSDTTERLHFHFSLSCNEEGNGNPLQCSCLENSRDGRAWWAAVYGVAQSWTRLKQLSSSSSMSIESVMPSNHLILCITVALNPFVIIPKSLYIYIQCCILFFQIVFLSFIMSCDFPL